MELIIYIKMDLALNNLQRLICHKTKPNKQIILNIIHHELMPWWKKGDKLFLIFFNHTFYLVFIVHASSDRDWVGFFKPSTRGEIFKLLLFLLSQIFFLTHSEVQIENSLSLCLFPITWQYIDWKKNIYITNLFGLYLRALQKANTQRLGLAGFYGISTIVGYLLPNPVFTYILNIYDL